MVHERYILYTNHLSIDITIYFPKNCIQHLLLLSIFPPNSMSLATASQTFNMPSPRLKSIPNIIAAQAITHTFLFGRHIKSSLKSHLASLSLGFPWGGFVWP